MVKIHYFFDPMCGWCFGATSLMEAIKATQGIELEMHPGGMIERRDMEASFRQMVLSHDERIESITGQHFGEAYKKRVNGDESIILDSFLTAQAIVAMEQLSNKGSEMLKAIQTAHYQRGLDVSELAVLGELATVLGAETSDWQHAMSATKLGINTIIAESRQQMSQWQITGFPTFVLETESETKRISHTQFYGHLADWKQWLTRLVSSS
ncbi:DsbA family protein [Vibrio sp. DW001]|uniref:DsbA family protein n=1 Tax=Vibrio sp. DW001 TaxID=2912315 RepID=UPI0023AE6E8F|nr:DsbA family protein [Vibrio sp. DW001]WED25658.1 DsbA family protein [Vibrio sp. DW001]